MRQVTHNIFTFDELSDAAKEKAREWFREDYPYDSWWDDVYYDAKECAQILGIEIHAIHFTGFSSQGDGAQFAGTYHYEKGSMKAIRGHAPHSVELHRIADALYKLQRNHFYKVTAKITTTGRYSHEYCTEISTYVGEDSPTYVLGSLNELLRDFMRWTYKQLETEYSYLMSAEYVDGSILCNGYEFTCNGEIYNESEN